jgi:hypothetical protein
MYKNGGQFAPKTGGQFGAKSSGQFKPFSGGQLRRFFQPTTDIVTVQIVSALASALTITAGKIIFKWITFASCNTFEVLNNLRFNLNPMSEQISQKQTDGDDNMAPIAEAKACFYDPQAPTTFFCAYWDHAGHPIGRCDGWVAETRDGTYICDYTRPCPWAGTT